jgi:hypothetical protein
MDPRKRQTATATPAEPGGLFDFARMRLFGLIRIAGTVRGQLTYVRSDDFRRKA